MTAREKIPIVVGVTGHRNIEEADREVLYGAVCAELSALKARCPHSPFVMLNSLADGADQLCAEAAAALSIPLIAVLPAERAEYERDFSGGALIRFRALCDAAQDCFAAPAVISTTVTVSFLLYDDADLKWMILVCGSMLFAAWAVQRLGRRIACHRRYLEFRTLAEGLRVQAFLRYAGSRLCVSDVLSWTEQTETPWVAAALKTCAAPKPYDAHAIKEPWVEQQRAYHASAAQKSKRTLLGSDRIVRTAFWVSVALYLGVLVFELVWGGLLPFGPQAGGADRVRTVSKLLLGGVSAAALFASNYYGRLSLSRTVSDHGKMERFYAAVSDRIDRYGQTEEILTLLAREELIENGNWCASRRDNATDFSL